MKAFRPHLAELRPRLSARGIEVGSTIRLPLEKQILDLAENGFVAAKGLDRKLAGATAREVKEAVDALAGKHVLVRIVRESGPGLVQPSAPVLEHNEIQELLRATAKLQKLLKAARPNRGVRPSVLRVDVEALVRMDRSEDAPRGSSDDRAGALSTPRATPTGGAGTEAGGSEALAQEIARRVRATSLPMRVPDLLRGMGLGAEAGKRALLDGASRGLFDLEPESGMGRLSREDAELCPPGPMGTRLSWVRARVQAGAGEGARS